MYISSVQLECSSYIEGWMFWRAWCIFCSDCCRSDSDILTKPLFFTGSGSLCSRLPRGFGLSVSSWSGFTQGSVFIAGSHTLWSAEAPHQDSVLLVSSYCFLLRPRALTDGSAVADGLGFSLSEAFQGTLHLPIKKPLTLWKQISRHGSH